MAVDLILAILHHLLVFTLVGILAAEFALVRKGLGGRTLSIVVHIDRMYGGIAGAVILIGIGRVIFGLKGWEYYVASHAFWGKMAAFLIVGLLSVPPTMRILRWSKAADADPSYVVPDAEIAAARRLIHYELAVFPLILIFAAMMARGMG